MEVLKDKYDQLEDIPENQKRREANVNSRNRLAREISNKKAALERMNNGPMSAIYKNKRINRAGPIRAGLIGGFASAGIAQLIGNEAERRRREYEAERGI